MCDLAYNALHNVCLDEGVVLRGCLTQSQFQAYGGKLDCHSVNYQGVSANGCFCEGDKCNGGGFSLSAVRKSNQ